MQHHERSEDGVRQNAVFDITARFDLNDEPYSEGRIYLAPPLPPGTRRQKCPRTTSQDGS
jgi:hypothetical protein